MNYIFAFAVGLGFAAGLRSFTPPAVVAWAAHLGWLNLNNSPLAFMGAIITAVIFRSWRFSSYSFVCRLRRRSAQPPSRSGPAFSWAVCVGPALARQAVNRGSSARFQALSAE